MDENLVAIARLRGSDLLILEVPHICILTLEPEDQDEDDQNEGPAQAQPDDNLAHIGLLGVLGKVGHEFNAKVCSHAISTTFALERPV